MSNPIPESENRTELRHRIIDSAMKSFIAEGIKSVTMDEVASRLAISKRTLYEIFNDKETLLLDCLAHFHVCRVEEMRAVSETGGNVMEVILHFYEGKMNELRNTNPRFYRDIKKYIRVENYMREWQEQTRVATYDFFARGVAEGLFRDDINLEITITLLREQIDSLFRSEVYQEFEMADVFNAIILTTLRGISTAKGRDMLEAYFQNR